MPLSSEARSPWYRRAVQDSGADSLASYMNGAIPAPCISRPLTPDPRPLTAVLYPLSTIHCPWTVGPFRPSLVRGDCPRNAPLSYATVPARFQPVASAPRARCRRLCEKPADRMCGQRAPAPAVPGNWPLTTDLCSAVIRSRPSLHESPKRAILQGRTRTIPGWTRTSRITHPPTHHAQAAGHVDLF